MTSIRAESGLDDQIKDEVWRPPNPDENLFQTILGKMIGSACAITGLLGPFHITSKQDDIRLYLIESKI